jgi:hypothetical protein
VLDSIADLIQPFRSAAVVLIALGIADGLCQRGITVVIDKLRRPCSALEECTFISLDLIMHWTRREHR